MMMTKIMEARQAARKNPLRSDEFKLLTLVIGEVETIQKRDISKDADEVATSVVKKLIQSNTETINRINVGYVEVVEKLKEENKILEALLPKQMSEQEIRDVFTTHFKAPEGQNVIGAFNQYMKTHYANQYDGKVASKVAKELSA